MQNKKNLLIWICLLIFIICFAFVITWIILQKQNDNIYDEMQEINSDFHTENVATETDDTVEATKEPVNIPIDFDSLNALNSEVYAWIRIPGTLIDYPILQRINDDSYYLNHTADGTEGLPGSIYTESVNSTDFSDRNTVIYGHDMKDKSMFGGLSDFVDKEYMNTNSIIYIYTPQNIFTYKIFAAITYDNRHIMHSFDFSTEYGFQEYLDSIFSVRNMHTYIDDSVQVDSSDRIITLSTCNGNENQRFLVEAVLIDEQ